MRRSACYLLALAVTLALLAGCKGKSESSGKDAGSMKSTMQKMMNAKMSGDQKQGGTKGQ